MPEFRQDPLTGEWVIVAPGRGQRPGHRRKKARTRSLPSHEPDCPFCPGNEDRLPDILAEERSGKSGGWSLRAVPNRYPSAAPEAAAGFGYHEVMIESPRHDARLHAMSQAEAAGVLRFYCARFADLAEHPGVRDISLFRNGGPGAGASLEHPHAQLIALGMRSARTERLAAWARKTFAETGGCAVCNIAGPACDPQAPLHVEACGACVTLVPYAATVPFEQAIMPFRHVPSFAQASGAELHDIAGALQRALVRLEALLGEIPVNLLFESDLPRTAAAGDRHWYLRVLPRVTTLGGFEFLSDMAVTPSLPEQDAELLRDAG